MTTSFWVHESKIVINPVIERRNPPLQPEIYARLHKSVERIGVAVPLIVRRLNEEKYELIAGHHRLRASRETGKTEVLIQVIETEAELEEALNDNTNRRQMTDAEMEADIAQHEETFRLVVLDSLIPELREFFDKGNMTFGQACEFALIPKEKQILHRVYVPRATDEQQREINGLTARYEEENNALQKKAAEAERQAEDARATTNALKNRLQSLTTERDEAKNRERNLKALVENALADLKKKEDRLEEAAREKVMAEIEEHREAAVEMSKVANDREKEIQKVKEELAKAKRREKAAFGYLNSYNVKIREVQKEYNEHVRYSAEVVAGTFAAIGGHVEILKATASRLQWPQEAIAVLKTTVKKIEKNLSAVVQIAKENVFNFDGAAEEAIRECKKLMAAIEDGQGPGAEEGSDPMDVGEGETEGEENDPETELE